MLSKFKYLILGGGPTGLGAAYRLKELGEESFLVIDKRKGAGGLSSTIKDENGFLWDIGGHIQFSHYEYFTRAMYKAIKKENWLSHQREAWVLLRNTFIPYPFQNNLKYLPKEEIWKCLDGLMDLNGGSSDSEISNFQDWIINSFGKGIADIFMNPYNFKVWAHPLEMMSFQWIGERVAVLDFQRLLQNIILNREDVAWGPNNTFEFPKYGGTGEIWKSIGHIIGENNFMLNSEIKSIDTKLKQVLLTNGNIIEYESLISTLPLDKLTNMAKYVPQKVSNKATKLLHSSTHILGIGLKGKTPSHLKSKCWMYFPENNSPYYRVTVFSNYSPNNVPDCKNNWSLMAEVSESSFKKCNKDELMQQTIKAMLEDGLIDSEENIISKWQHFEDYGYPVPSLDRDSILSDVIPFFEDMNIYSRGRFGAWKYEVSNQDHSFMQGVEIVNRLELGETETTLNNASLVNKLEEKENESEEASK
jgi:protoporphyrinogen oxidase